MFEFECAIQQLELNHSCTSLHPKQQLMLILALIVIIIIIIIVGESDIQVLFLSVTLEITRLQNQCRNLENDLIHTPTHKHIPSLPSFTFSQLLPCGPLSKQLQQWKQPYTSERGTKPFCHVHTN